MPQSPPPSNVPMPLCRDVFGLPVAAMYPAELVALGAARQAAWTLADSSRPPEWRTADQVIGRQHLIRA